MMSEETKSTAESGVYNRRQFMKVATMTAGGALLAACNQSPTPPAKITEVPTLGPAAVTATAGTLVGKTYFPSPAPNVPDAFTAPLPAFQSVSTAPGRGGAVNVFSVTYGTPEVPKEMNRFWQQMEQRLNVTWNVNFAAGNESYAEKVSTLLASGNLPDLFLMIPAIAPTLLQAMLQGAFTDLTPYLSGQALNDYPNIARYPSVLWENVARNGKIYGVPRPSGLTGSALFYRRDWAQKLGIPTPKNANDFYKLMVAMTKGDPDRDGRADTWGMGFTATGLAGHQFFMNMFRVPNQWRQEANGGMTYYIQTDEYRQAIAFMAKMYAAGLFYPNSLTQTGLQSKQNFTAGKYGSYLDTFTELHNQRAKIKTLNPHADVQVLVPFGADGGKGNHWTTFGYNGFTGISSSAGADPDQAKELLRILDYLAAPTFSVESNFLALGVDGWDNTRGPNGVKARTPTGNNEMGSLMNVANGPLVYYYPDEPALGPVVQEYTRQLLAIGVGNPVVHLVSQTAVTRRGPLEALINDRVLRIVKGTDPLSALDDLVRQWKAQGGTQIAREYAQTLNK